MTSQSWLQPKIQDAAYTGRKVSHDTRDLQCFFCYKTVQKWLKKFVCQYSNFYLSYKLK